MKPWIPLAGCGVLFAALMVTAAEPDWGAVDWGDFPTWLTLVATLGVLIAVSALIRIQLAREPQREHEQAERVAAWTQAGRVTVLNGSDLPVWDVHIATAAGETGSAWGQHVAVVPPGAVEFATHLNADAAGEVRISFRDAAGARWRRDGNGVLVLVARGSGSST